MNSGHKLGVTMSPRHHPSINRHVLLSSIELHMWGYPVLLLNAFIWRFA